MKIKRFARDSGKVLCGVSFALVLTAGGQEVDPFSDDPFRSDPFANHERVFRKGKVDEVLKAQQEQVAVMIEMIEVDHVMANDLILKYSKKANDVGEMRKELVGLVKKGEAKFRETLWGRSPLNEMGKIEATVEKIYPTEYDPPRFPQVVAGESTDKKGAAVRSSSVAVTGDLYTSATPNAFDTRNVGTLFEFEVAKSVQNPEQVGVSMYLSVVDYLQEDTFSAEGFEEEARGTKNITMPRFSNIAQEFVATVTLGKHSLLGIFKEGADESESKRVIILMHVEMIATE